MKNKLIKTLTMALGCLMLTLTISTGVLNHNTTNTNSHVVHVDMEMPHGWNNIFLKKELHGMIYNHFYATPSKFMEKFILKWFYC